MICAVCGSETAATPCTSCGNAPVLRKRYRLAEVLVRRDGESTYRAFDTVNEVDVAITEHLLPASISDKMVERACREAKALVSLDHPQIPAHTEQFIHGAGRSKALYIVQEELVGDVDLADIASRRSFDEKEVLSILLEILRILEHLHGLAPPMPHGNLCLSNVRRSAEGRLMLVGFGSVRAALIDPATDEGRTAGTPGYMPPEQGEEGAVPAADLYAVGALAVSMLTLKEPAALLDGAHRSQWATHALVTKPTADLIDWLVELNPRKRASYAAEVRHRIEAILTGKNEKRPSSEVPTELLKDSALAPTTPKTTAGSTFWTIVFGSPMTLEYIEDIKGRIGVDSFDELVQVADKTLGIPGRAKVIGYSLHYDAQVTRRFIEVRIRPLEGRTEIVVRERLGALAGALFGGWGGGIGGGLGVSGALWVVSPADPVGFVLWLIFCAGGAWIVAWMLFRWFGRSRTAELHELTGKLVVAARAEAL